MAAGRTGDGASGAAFDEPFLLQLLRLLPRAVPPASADRPSGFRFLPHALILPPSSPPPPVKDVVARVRVPIPRGLPPGPWEPPETSPPQITDLQSSHGPGNRPGETGDRNVPWGSNFQKNRRLQPQNTIAGYQRREDGWNTAPEYTPNGRAGYVNNIGGANAMVDGRFGDRWNADAGPVHAVRYQHEKKHPTSGDSRRSLTWRPRTTDQMRPQKQKFKVEWVAVATTKDEKQQAEEESPSKKKTNKQQASHGVQMLLYVD
ncbi:hypothetical protein OPV22_000322 [Ensete ventricosum]|uniref:Peroxin-13 n=1 Tax=Ensete ventricosum TaxID=4639 RepID=A0AAV8RT12_ENSVE|nr:hypothetical protein OPV22_000322 [Ensete ventricosum]RWW18705.1 hypothetical protein GW17_00017288 [Ensete ventricosum]RWW47078.1 hypothetical protein BHE74_00046963 [Ensete ventricosum]